MVQEFQVLRCFSCHTFQVHQVKKIKKWLCKVCGEKQSLVKVYGQGSAADCRHHVQKLNLLQGEVEHTANTTAGLTWQNDDDSTQSSISSQSHIGAPISCWSKYLEKDSGESCVKQEEEEDNGGIYTDQEHFYTQNITSETRKRKNMPPSTCDFKEQDFSRGTHNSKKKRTCEKWAASTEQTVEPSYLRNETVGNTEGHRRAMSPATYQPTCSGSKWERSIPAQEEVHENISRTQCLHKKGANVQPTLNKCYQNQHLSSVQPKTSLESVLPRPVHERRLLSDQQKGCAPIPNDDTAEGKLPCSSIFQTDEDFDENY
ncbi:MRN complex-interacting protein [Mantella aurantiaca]